MRVPVAAERGRSQVASRGLIWNGLVQIAFWSRRIRFGVPAKVIGSDFLGGAGADGGVFCGWGASGRRLKPLGVAVLCAGQKLAVPSKREAARKRDALNLG
jgi:hypothetical protein